eukprot:gene19234-biopygen6970
MCSRPSARPGQSGWGVRRVRALHRYKGMLSAPRGSGGGTHWNVSPQEALMFQRLFTFQWLGRARLQSPRSSGVVEREAEPILKISFSCV